MTVKDTALPTTTLWHSRPHKEAPRGKILHVKTAFILPLLLQIPRTNTKMQWQILTVVLREGQHNWNKAAIKTNCIQLSFNCRFSVVERVSDFAATPDKGLVPKLGDIFEIKVSSTEDFKHYIYNEMMGINYGLQCRGIDQQTIISWLPNTLHILFTIKHYVLSVSMFRDAPSSIIRSRWAISCLRSRDTSRAWSSLAVDTSNVLQLLVSSCSRQKTIHY